MQQRFFIKPFAAAGDREKVPSDTQATGDVSYEQGYGYDYQRDQATDPLAKPIERNKHNALLHDITEALQQYQMFGIPEWIDESDNEDKPYPYARRTRVRYQASKADTWEVYESLVDNNTAAPSDKTKWAIVASTVASQEQALAGIDNSTIMTPLRVAQVIANTQLGLPPGAICYFAQPMPPEGYLVCNGEAVSRRTYKALFEAIGTIYGEGDRKATFNLPDCSSQFIRGWGNGRGIDADRVFGSAQSHAIQSHTHSAISEEAGNHHHGGVTSTDGEHTHLLGAKFTGGEGWHGGDLNKDAGQDAKTHPSGNHQHTIKEDGTHQHAIKIQTTGGSETRPSNISMLICIKY